MKIPPIPQMTELDEKWIAWAAGWTGISPEQARGLLAGWYTMKYHEDQTNLFIDPKPTIPNTTPT